MFAYEAIWFARYREEIRERLLTMAAADAKLKSPFLLKCLEVFVAEERQKA